MSRKQKKYHFIYKTTNLLNGKYYIGMHSTSDLDDGYLGSGKRLRYSINKHGKDNHKVEILEFVDTRQELKVREEEIINLNEIAKVDCMNLKVGGYGGFSTETHRLKAQIAGAKAIHFKLKNDSNFKEEFCGKVSEGLKKAYERGTRTPSLNMLGKTHSEEAKQKISESNKGNRGGEDNSQYGTCWITKDGENKKIKKEDLENHTSDGWIKGRKIKSRE